MLLDSASQGIVKRLGLGVALTWASTSMAAGPGSAAFVSLSGHLAYAGLFVATLNVGAAGGAAIAGRAMDRFGRFLPLTLSYCVAALGYTIAGVGVLASTFGVFVAGSLILAASMGGINLSRLAAAELYPPAQRAQGVGAVQVYAIIGAVLGPLLLLLTEPLGRALGRPPLELVWFIAPPLFLIGAYLINEARRLSARVAPANVVVETLTTAAAPLPIATIVAGTLALAATQAGMAAVMGVAGAAVSHAGHGVRVLSATMVSHFVGMFGLSRVIGRFADRVGRRATIFVGLALLASGGLIVTFVHGPAGFAIGLMVVGLGWSFGFIGATVLLSDAVPAAMRARTVGRADLVAQLSAALVATGGGWWFASHGVGGLGLVAIVAAAIPAIALVLTHDRGNENDVMKAAKSEA